MIEHYYIYIMFIIIYIKRKRDTMIKEVFKILGYMPISEHKYFIDNVHNVEVEALIDKYDELGDLYGKQQKELDKINKRVLDYNKKLNLELYRKNKFRNINGRSRLLNSWLKEYKQFETLYSYLKQKKELIVSKDFKTIVLKSLENMQSYIKPIKNYVKDEGADKWFKPMEFVDNNFKGDCDDFATYMYYYIACQLYHNDLWEQHKEDLFFCNGATSTLDGWALENHAYNIIRYEGNYYVLESTAYAKERNAEIFKLSFPFNKYPMPVLMSNYTSNYVNPVLISKV